MTIKQETLDTIANSLVIMASFDKYGHKTKVSLTYHDKQYAYTVMAWVNLTFNKTVRLTSWSTLPDTLKPTDYTAQRTDKATGQQADHSDSAKCKAVFNAVCFELANRVDTVHLDAYMTYKKA